MTTRKDSRGYALRTGEYQRPDGRYSYSYTDLNKKRRTIYEKDLRKLRKREEEIKKIIESHVDYFYAERITVEELCNMYMKQKKEIRESTAVNYRYTIDNFIVPFIGQWKITTIRSSHIKEFYYQLLEEEEIARSTLENVHTILHPAFDMAVRDDYLKKNPTNGIMKEIKANEKYDREHRIALTVPEQNLITNFLLRHDEYASLRNMIFTFLGTGGRIAEITGLRWTDLDFEKNLVYINHQVTYHKGEDGKCRFRGTSKLKTRNSLRSIPMFDDVRNALLDEYELSECIGFSNVEVDGFTNFIFTTYEGNPYTPTSINQTLERIREAANKEEAERAEKEMREPLQVRHFSAHNLRHTFCTRLCEVETNIKLIQSIMGHADISTTMNIYAEVTEEKKAEAASTINLKVLSNNETN